VPTSNHLEEYHAHETLYAMTATRPLWLSPIDPARELKTLLDEDRAAGAMPFLGAFDDNVEFILRRIHDERARELWETILRASIGPCHRAWYRNRRRAV
jgi:hypothetical protein